MHQIIEGLKGVASIADDMLVYGCGDTDKEALRDHDKNMIALLNRCRERDLHLNKDKLQINRQATAYMYSALCRSRRAAADFLVSAPPTQYIEVSIFSWTVLYKNLDRQGLPYLVS